MKKKIILASMLLLGSFSFGSTAPGDDFVKDDSIVTITVKKLPKIVVGDIPFTTWMIGQTPGKFTADINITDGSGDEDMTIYTAKTLTLTGGDGDNTDNDIEATMSFEGANADAVVNGDNAECKITLDSNGAQDLVLTATIGTIADTQSTGDYTGTAVIYATYN